MRYVRVDGTSSVRVVCGRFDRSTNVSGKAQRMTYAPVVHSSIKVFVKADLQ